MIDKTINALRRNGIAADYYEKREDAVESLLSEIGPDESVGIGGSVTVSDLGIPQKLIERGNEVNFHWLVDTPEKKYETKRKAVKADVYLTSTNALTEAGQLVNIDGTGNRVSAMIYGPKKVFVICGFNKIVKDLDAALERIKSHTYLNAERFRLNTPCAVTHRCMNCNSPQRMCNVTTIIEKKPRETALKVILVGEELGF